VFLEPPPQPSFEETARGWQAARVVVAESTRTQHRIQLDKLLR
jgi:hypothetical protein